jgi:hypothetical protein
MGSGAGRDCGLLEFGDGMSANDTQIGGQHYRENKIQVWDAVIDWGLEFLDGNAVKYLARWRKKGGITDLMKARHYIDKLIEEETKSAPSDIT